MGLRGRGWDMAVRGVVTLLQSFAPQHDHQSQPKRRDKRGDKIQKARGMVGGGGGVLLQWLGPIWQIGLGDLLWGTDCQPLLQESQYYFSRGKGGGQVEEFHPPLNPPPVVPPKGATKGTTKGVGFCKGTDDAEKFFWAF